jgi:glycosyltransferase involved in cell wall biosynthesis
MRKERRLLFYGELPPDSINGIANANHVNLEMLKSHFRVDIIQEKSNLAEHEKISIWKLVQLIENNFLIISKSIFHKYDFFYLTFSLSTTSSFKALTGIFFFRLFNRGKVVLHLHRGDFFTRFYVKKVNRFIAKLTFNFSHKIIVLSDNQKHEFDAVFNKSCYVLHNTVELEYPSQVKNRHTSKFIYISNYLIGKGIMDLLEVFAELSNEYKEITLSTYGAFSDIRLKEKIFKFNSSQISIHGPISAQEKFKIIAEADCLILPSWNEGQPIILLEAMSVGTPVITSKVGLIPELLGADYPFLSMPRDKSALKKVILQFMKQENTTSISQKLEKRYAEYYSQKKHEESLLNIFC